MFLLYVMLWFAAVTRTVKSKFVVLVMIGCGVLIGMTFSRGVWGTTLVTVPLIMMVFIRRRQMKLTRLISMVAILVFAVTLAFVIAASTIFARLSATQVSTSAQTRDTASQVGVCVLEHRPIFGVGYQAFLEHQDIYGCNPNGNSIRPHNIYVQDW